MEGRDDLIGAVRGRHRSDVRVDDIAAQRVCCSAVAVICERTCVAVDAATGLCSGYK